MAADALSMRSMKLRSWQRWMDGWASLHQAMEAQSVSSIVGLGFDPQLLSSNFATAKLRAGNCGFSVM
ncbi:hypothetical protein Peur_059144 [Populus x canadensis]